jgi:hypothetical protein
VRVCVVQGSRHSPRGNWDGYWLIGEGLKAFGVCVYHFLLGEGLAGGVLFKAAGNSPGHNLDR